MNFVFGVSVSILVCVVGGEIRRSGSAEKTDKLLASMISSVAVFGISNPILPLFLKNGISYLSADKFPSLYLELLWLVKSSYYTTIRTTVDEIQLGHNRMGLEIQRTKVLVSKCDVRRIFICSNLEEVSSLRSAMEDHSNAGVKVRYISIEAIESNHMLKPWLKKFESLDFSIVDTGFTLTTLTNRKNLVDKFRLSADSSETKLYVEFFQILYEEALEYKG